MLLDECETAELTGMYTFTWSIVQQFSYAFAALTYQHAFFVDPGLCEAVASAFDSGLLAVNHALNRTVGFFIPAA